MKKASGRTLDVAAAKASKAASLQHGPYFPKGPTPEKTRVLRAGGWISTVEAMPLARTLSGASRNSNFQRRLQL